MNSSPNDTIAALATAPGEGAIAIIRISGPDTYRIADTIFQGHGAKPSQRPGFSFAYGEIMDANEQRIDDVLMLFMRAPRSYTGEDQVEIQAHGGSVSARRILRLTLEQGARSAEPGEFTRRAFLNGRLDLVQAEAVLDLIKARSERAAQAAVLQLNGAISCSLKELYNNTIHVVADLEATMDFPEDELPEAVMADVLTRLDHIERQAQTLLATWTEGRLLREGALVVIAGRPNAVKSTLLNTLLGRNRAIVSDQPGTTRDTLEEDYVLHGIPLRLVDTAGLRESTCAIEREGIQRSRQQLDQADAILYLIDRTAGLHAEDLAELLRFPPEKTLIVWTRMDSAAHTEITPNPPAPNYPTVAIDARDPKATHPVRTGLDNLLRATLPHGNEPHAAISERHRALLVTFQQQTQQARDLLTSRREDHIPLASSHLRDALESLGEATGNVYHHELLNTIFSRFCIGK